MATTSILLGTTAGLDIIGGLFNMDAAGIQADSLKTQASLVRSEADADAERYRLEAGRFKAGQKLAYLKSGVTLEGSPLDVLDETARLTQENLAAMQAQSAAKAQGLEGQAVNAANAGRAAFVQGITSAAGLYARYAPTPTPAVGEKVAKAGPTSSGASGSKTYNKSARLNLYSGVTGFK